jgi:hypothetical protein
MKTSAMDGKRGIDRLAIGASGSQKWRVFAQYAPSVPAGIHWPRRTQTPPPRGLKRDPPPRPAPRATPGPT